MVTVDAVLKTEDDWIVGRSTDAAGTLGPAGPFVNTAATAGTIAITIKERLIPLTQETQYLHDVKLDYQNG